MLNLWFDNLILGANSLNLTIYSPADWFSIRSSLVLILASLSSLPLFSLMLHRFIVTGLLPKEQRWLTLILSISAFIIPVFLVLMWIWILPASIDIIQNYSNLDGVGIRYNAAAIIGLGLGISWLFLIGIFTTISLSVARLVGLVDRGETKFRIRIILISGSMLILTLPIVYDGLKIFLSVLTIFIADRIASTVPDSPLGRRNFLVHDNNILGEFSRVGIVDCSCEGSCPSMPKGLKYSGIALPVCSAICLNQDEQNAIFNLVVEHNLSKLVITGCDSSPVPSILSKAITEADCQLVGLNWLDALNLDDDGKRQRLADLMDE